MFKGAKLNGESEVSLGKSRRKTFLLGNTASLGANGVSILVGLVSVPIGLHYFGPVRYGVWMVISSILAYLSLSQFGIGTAAQTLIARAVNPSHQRIILRRAFFLLVSSSVIFVSAFLLFSHYLPGWGGVLGKIPSSLQSEATDAALAIGVLFLLRLPTMVFNAAFTGLQEMYWERFYASLATVVGLVTLVATVLVKGNLVTLALFRGFGGLTVGVLGGIHLLLAHPNIRPRLMERVSNAPSLPFILASGGRFFIICIATMIIRNTDNLVISHFLGPGEVTPYAVTFRLFAVGFSLFTMVNGVLWPMYGRAAGMNQWEWIQRTYNRVTSILPILGGLVWIGGIAFARAFINLWVGPSAYGGGLIVISLGGYGYCLSLVNCHSTVLTGLNATRNLVIFGLLEAALNLGFSLALIGPLGIGGVALGTFLAALVSVFWLLPMDVARQTKGEVRFRHRAIAIHAVTVLFPAVIGVHLLSAYGPSGWSGALIKMLVVVLYLILSWRISPLDLRCFVWDFISDNGKDLLTRMRMRRKN